MISKFIKDLHPCLKEVPIQSVPVSPPPITITFLSFADMKFPSSCSESNKLLVFFRKKSMAK